MENVVVGIGEALWDMLPEGRRPGGAPANFAYHVSQFGLPGYAVSAVGDDSLGEELVGIFQEKGLHCHMAVVPFPTGTVDVELDAAGVPRYDIREDVAWDNIPFTPELEALAKRTRAVCFGSLAQRGPVSRGTINRFLDAMAPGDGALVVFDVNLRQHYYDEDVLRSSMERCNVLKINDEELAEVGRLFGMRDFDFKMTCRALVEKFALKILILTCGTDGSYVFTPGCESFIPTPVVDVADTVGAGDSFTAAFTACILKGMTVTEAHEAAVRTSAYVCTQHGATPQLPGDLIV
ncbi:MAG: carbohydrate kinase [Muribaculaceae bacterium]|nr:carbohydrate kinase [Muribaculaceae bacterium]